MARPPDQGCLGRQRPGLPRPGRRDEPGVPPRLAGTGHPASGVAQPVDGRDGRRGGVQQHRHACNDASPESGLTIREPRRFNVVFQAKPAASNSPPGVPASIKQGTVVNMDILAGVAVLDPDLAVVLQG